MDSSKKVLLSTIGIAILIVFVTGVTFAFFNYTRTGSSNAIKVGRISFSSDQTTININNVFPIDKANINSDTDYVGNASIHITGDTTYSEGIEYVLTVVDLNNTINSKKIPISVSVTPSSGLGTREENYFDDRDNADESIYKVLSKNTVEEDDQLLVGYIKNGQSGIDGAITIKAYLDKNRIAISDTYPPTPEGYILNDHMSASEYQSCLTFVDEEWRYSSYIDSGSSAESFCNGTGTSNGVFFQSWIDNDWFNDSEFDFLLEHRIVIIPEEKNETTSEWVKGRVVLTTSEWNSLQTNGVSFKVKVEANEGIWVEEHQRINAMSKLSDLFYNTNTNVKEIYFVNMDEDTMIQRYEEATIKDDITYNNEGKVLAWYEQNSLDNTKYNLIIASEGETYLTLADNRLFYADRLYNVEKIEFNNVNTSRITNMYGMFYGLSNLKSLDLRSFDTSNVVNMSSFIYNDTSIESVNMEGLDLRKVQNMSGMFQGNRSLTILNLNGTTTRDVINMSNLLYNTNYIESINLNGWGGDDLENVSNMFSSSNEVKYLSMSGFNFGKVSNINSMFYSLYNLKTIDLSNANMNSVVSMYNLFKRDSNLEVVDLSNVSFGSLDDVSYMFYDCSKLNTIIVSEDWNIQYVTNSDSMFSGCSMLVGGNGTHYDWEKANKLMAVIDNNDHEGYLTLKTN